MKKTTETQYTPAADAIWRAVRTTLVKMENWECGAVPTTSQKAGNNKRPRCTTPATCCVLLPCEQHCNVCTRVCRCVCVLFISLPLEMLPRSRPATLAAFRKLVFNVDGFSLL